MASIFQLNDLRTTTRPQCIFSGIKELGACSTEKQLNLIICCANHASGIFGLHRATETIMNGINKNLIVLDVLKYTDVTENFLPFPFKLVIKPAVEGNAALNIRAEPGRMEFCLSTADMLTSFNTLPLRLQRITPILASLIYGGETYVANSQVNQIFHSYVKNPTFIATLQNHWRDVKVSCFDKKNIYSVSMLDFPIFYQVLFYYAIMDTTCASSKTGTNNPRLMEPVTVRQPNLIVNLELFRFQVINSSISRPLFIHSSANDTTFATPLILSGTAPVRGYTGIMSTTSGIQNFNQMHSYLPNMCAGANV
ncbi:MAG: hypothetical protein MUO31_07090 [Thermodesulfovibrionales bacterium]|nr:hypothetical protein [Thermodesulfovibrionales bacterium]